MSATPQKFPEDAFVAWQREHYNQTDPVCPDADSNHCAFMSGIAYTEEQMPGYNNMLDALNFTCRLWSQPKDPSPIEINAAYETCKNALTSTQKGKSTP